MLNRSKQQTIMKLLVSIQQWGWLIISSALCIKYIPSSTRSKRQSCLNNMLLSSALNLTAASCCQRFLEKAFASLQGDLHPSTKELFNFLSRPPQEPLCPHTMLTAGWLSEESAFIFFLKSSGSHCFPYETHFKSSGIPSETVTSVRTS